MGDLGSPVSLSGTVGGNSRVRPGIPNNPAAYGSYYGSQEQVDPSMLVPGASTSPNPSGTSVRATPYTTSTPPGTPSAPVQYRGVTPGRGRKIGPPRPDRLFNPNVQGQALKGLSLDSDEAKALGHTKDSVRAYRAQFQPGGSAYEAQADEDAYILAANPKTKAELVQVLHSLGIYDEKERGRSRFRSYMMDFDNQHVLGTNYHIGPDGQMYDVATSDVDPNSPTARGVGQPIDPNIKAQLDRGFLGRLEDRVGVSEFQKYADAGEVGVFDPASQMYYNTDAEGNVTWWDKRGFQIDPNTGEPVGHYLRPGSKEKWGGAATSTVGANPNPPYQAPTQLPPNTPTGTVTGGPPGGSTGLEMFSANKAAPSTYSANAYTGLAPTPGTDVVDPNAVDGGDIPGGKTGPGGKPAIPGTGTPGFKPPAGVTPPQIPGQLPTSGLNPGVRTYTAGPGYQPTGPSAQEQTMIAAITELARMLGGQGKGLFDVSTGAYAEAINYFKTLLGDRATMQASTAPAAELIAEQARGAERAINSGYMRGGAKDAALGDLKRLQFGETARLTQGVQKEAAGALMSGGLAGASLATQQTGQIGQLYTNVLTNLTQGRLTEAQIAEQSRQFEIGTQINTEQFQANLAEAMRSHNLSYNQAMSALALDKWFKEYNFAQQAHFFQVGIEQWQKSMGMENKRYQQQRDDAKGSQIGQLLIGGAGAAAGLGFNPFGGGPTSGPGISYPRSQG